MAQIAAVTDDGDYPLANTRASRLLADALERMWNDEKQSARSLAKTLGYRTSTVLSHMSTGRAPIPLDRALDFARLMKIDPREFVLAVLEQRHPDIDFARVLFGGKRNVPKSSQNDEDNFVIEELESVAGMPLAALPSSKMRLLKEMIREPRPEARWLSLNELAVAELFRKARPDITENGLSFADRRKLEEFLKTF